jgi:hypothetical protein
METNNKNMKHVKIYENFVNESKINESKVTITKLNPTTFRLEVDSKFGQTTLTAGSEKEAEEMKSKIEKAFKDGKINAIGGIGAAVYEKESAKDKVQDLVQNMSAKKYKDFAFDNDIDHRDAMEMQDFLSSLSDAEAEAILKKYGKYNESSEALSESTFSVEDGIKVQSEQLAQWKKLLQPKVYKDLEKWATEHNDKAESGNQIIRGTDMDNFIGNYFNSYTPSNKR